MASPYVSKTIAKIEATADVEQRDILVAELACYWARVGEFGEAERLRGELRERYGDGRSAPVSILIMCLEALLLYYKELSPHARDRMQRANILSVAFGQARLNALTAAWMAHIDFNLNRIDTMAKYLQSCFECIYADDGAALCRASLVLGDAFLFAEDVGAARIWYEKARQAAVTLGDQAAVGAVTYNRAALHVSMARFRSLTQVIDAQELVTLKAEVESAVSYQIIANIKALDHLLLTAQVGVLLLNSMREAAEPVLKRLLSDPSIDPSSSQARLLVADLNVIRALRGETVGLHDWLQAVSTFVGSLSNADDRALIYNAASVVAAVLLDDRLRGQFAAASAREIEEHNVSVQQLRLRIAPYVNGQAQ